MDKWFWICLAASVIWIMQGDWTNATIMSATAALIGALNAREVERSVAAASTRSDKGDTK